LETFTMKALLQFFAGAACLLLASPCLPHHAFAAEFDINQPVILQGRVTKMEWTNPHAWLFMESVEGDGIRQAWAVELVGTNDLLRLGWGRSRVEEGDEISVTGYRARNGTNTANAASVIITATGELLWESAAQRNRP
jgi:hypothetical protein